MKKPIRLLRDGQISHIPRDAIVLNKDNGLFVNRETMCFENRIENCVMVQRIGPNLYALGDDLENLEPREITLEELQTANYIPVTERKTFLSKGFDPD
ncbi:MAG: hypothetical protein KatS3mg101_0325 [Patescibacteria group bacterium]|nr:MAG: hypothetical protein KatS3mg101_0325 [Patescibacteria group bacterium]